MNEPTEAEVKAARKWPAKRGVEVAEPTTLPALRLGARRGARPPGYWAWCAVLFLAMVLCGFVVRFLPLLLGVARADRFAGGYLFVVYAALPVLIGLSVRWADRRAATWLGDRRLDVPRPQPALFALPVLVDVLATSRVPREFTPWLIGYVVPAVATLLPAGNYGTAAVAVR